jgi:hypothetical protein
MALPISLIGTFGVMHLFHYGLDNLSLMALIIAVGFVVDDAIVMVENVARHIEKGLPPLQAALKGVNCTSATLARIVWVRSELAQKDEYYHYHEGYRQQQTMVTLIAGGSDAIS